MTPIALAADRVLLDDGQLHAATLVLDDGRIAEVREGIDPAAQPLHGIVVPGYVDTHCHGARGVAFGQGDPTPAIEHHHAHGSTTLMASTVTASMGDLRAQLDVLRPFVGSGELAGVHLEGPFLSPERKGAHQPGLLRAPGPDLLAPLLGDPVVRMVTLAPELPGGLDAVGLCRDHGVVAAFGHSDADAPTTAGAIDAGMTVATHLFNAMRPIGHRVPGPVPVLLHDRRMVVELIADGVHVAPEVLLMAIDAAGPHRVALVTDAISATGQPDGPQLLGNLPVEVRDGIARLATGDGTEGALAGSTLTLDRAVERLVALGVPLADAVTMATATPARAHGLDEVGVLAPGRRADLCVLDEQAHLLGVLRHGRWLVEPPGPADPTHPTNRAKDTP